LAHPLSSTYGRPIGSGAWRGLESKVDLFEQLRREHEFGVARLRVLLPSSAFTGVSCGRRLAVHCRRDTDIHRGPSRSSARSRTSSTRCWRQTVRRAQATPHRTAHHRRILTEFPDATVAESTVRNHVRERKRQMGLARRETFVPQSYGWLRRPRSTGMKPGSISATSGPACRYSRCGRWQRSGVPSRLPACDAAGIPGSPRARLRLFRRRIPPAALRQSGSAVRKILRGYRREETVRFLAFRSHWRFAASSALRRGA